MINAKNILYKNFGPPSLILFEPYTKYFQVEVSWTGGTPVNKTFHEINHPAIGVAPFQETPYYHSWL